MVIWHASVLQAITMDLTINMPDVSAGNRGYEAKSHQFNSLWALLKCLPNPRSHAMLRLCRSVRMFHKQSGDFR